MKEEMLDISHVQLVDPLPPTLTMKKLEPPAAENEKLLGLTLIAALQAAEARVPEISTVKKNATVASRLKIGFFVGIENK